mgnify:CR=1 FL=1
MKCRVRVLKIIANESSLDALIFSQPRIYREKKREIIFTPLQIVDIIEHYIYFPDISRVSHYHKIAAQSETFNAHDIENAVADFFLGAANSNLYSMGLIYL